MEALYRRIESDFQHRDVDKMQLAKINKLREVVIHAAKCVAELVPESREQSLSLTKLEEAAFWANAGISRYTNGVKEK